MPDIGDNASTTISLGLGRSYRGTLETGDDSDWIRVQLVAGQTYSFSLDGYGLNPVRDTYLRLRNASGQEIASDDDAGAGFFSQISFKARTSGTYYVDVQSYLGSYSGDYLVSMNTIDAPSGLPVFNYQQIANQLTSGYWVEIGAGPRHFPTSTVTVNLTGLTAAGVNLARSALQTWGDVTGLTFLETTNTAQITFDDFDDNRPAAGSRSAVSGTSILSSEVNVSQEWLATFGTEIQSYSFQTYIHEIGHALGLGHAGSYNGSGSYPFNAHYANDSWQATVMSYIDQDKNTFVNGTKAFAITPMVADIVAIQNLYHSPPNTRSGNTVYGFSSTAGYLYEFANYTQGDLPALTLYDSGGIDTLNASRYTAKQFINLSPGRYSNIGGEVGNVGIATNTVIERAIGGSGADTIRGNHFANSLRGLSGNDVLTGLRGNDIFRFDTALDTETNVDRIVDFDVDDSLVQDSFDTIQLENAIFKLLTTTGDLAASRFARVNDAAHFDNGSTITYVSSTGDLYYDMNGSRDGGATLFAKLSTRPAVSHLDFVVT